LKGNKQKSQPYFLSSRHFVKEAAQLGGRKDSMTNGTLTTGGSTNHSIGSGSPKANQHTDDQQF